MSDSSPRYLFIFLGVVVLGLLCFVYYPTCPQYPLFSIPEPECFANFRTSPHSPAKSTQQMPHAGVRFGKGLIEVSYANGYTIKSCRIEKNGNSFMRDLMRELAAAPYPPVVDGYNRTVWYLHKRNPYIRVVSMFHDKSEMLQRISRDSDLKHPVISLSEPIPSLDAFLQLWEHFMRQFPDPLATHIESVHFLPGTTICRPDLVHYDFMLETETLFRDHRCLWSHLFQGLVVSLSQPTVNGSPGRSAELVSQLLTPEAIKSINQIYAADFIHFGYPVLNPHATYTEILHYFNHQLALIHEKSSIQSH